MDNEVESKAHNLQPSWTSHAILRGQQRGIKQGEVNVVFNHGDVENFAGSNCYHLKISRSTLLSLLKEGCICPKLAEKCKKLVVLTDGHCVITTYRTSHLH